MIVSMIQLIVELPEITSIKDKRRLLASIKQRVIRKFNVSFAEVDLHDSLGFVQFGGAIVSNSKQYGENVMNKILLFVERESLGRVQDVQIVSETY